MALGTSADAAAFLKRMLFDNERVRGILLIAQLDEDRLSEKWLKQRPIITLVGIQGGRVNYRSELAHDFRMPRRNVARDFVVADQPLQVARRQH